MRSFPWIVLCTATVLVTSSAANVGTEIEIRNCHIWSDATDDPITHNQPLVVPEANGIKIELDDMTHWAPGNGQLRVYQGDRQDDNSYAYGASIDDDTADDQTPGRFQGQQPIFTATGKWRFEVIAYTPTVAGSIPVINQMLIPLYQELLLAQPHTYFMVSDLPGYDIVHIPARLIRRGAFHLLVSNYCLGGGVKQPALADRLSGYSQFNVDFTPPQFLDKLDQIQENDFRLLQGLYADQNKAVVADRVKANFLLFRKWSEMCEWTVLEKLHLFFLSNVYNNSPIRNDGVFKNAYYLMPKTIWPSLAFDGQTTDPSLVFAKLLKCAPPEHAKELARLDGQIPADPRYCKQQETSTDRLRNLATRGILIGEWRDTAGWFDLPLQPTPGLVPNQPVRKLEQFAPDQVQLGNLDNIILPRVLPNLPPKIKKAKSTDGLPSMVKRTKSTGDLQRLQRPSSDLQRPTIQRTSSLSDVTQKRRRVGIGA